MSSSDFAIDTNAVVALMRGDVVIARQLGVSAILHMPVTVLGELYFGAERSARVQENLARVEQFRGSVTLLVADASTAREFGRLNHLLRSKGTPIPENDMWIAASALQHGLRWSPAMPTFSRLMASPL